MKKALKILLWAAGAAMLLLAIAALGLKLYFTPARLKAMTLDYAAKNLGREVAFDSVGLSLAGFSINNLRLSEFPDFKKGEFLSAAAFSVRPALRPLLRRQIIINSISAEGLKLRVVEVRKNVYNFSDLVKVSTAAAAAKPAGEQAAPPPPLAVASLKVRGSMFSYANAAGDLAVALRDINFSASNLSPEGLFPLEAEFSMDVKSPYFTGTVPAAIKGRVALGGGNIEKGRAELDKATLALSGLKAELKGNFNNLMEPDGKLSINVKSFSTSDLKKVFKDLPSGLQLPEMNADADFKFTLKDINLRAVELRAGPFKASLKGGAGWEPKVTYSLAVELNAGIPEIDTGELAKQLKQFPIPGGYKLPAADLSARLTLKDGAADIKSFSLKSGALDLDGKCTVNFGGPALKASGTAKAGLKDLSKLAAIAPALLKPYALSGAAGAALDFSYAAELAVKGTASLNGIGAVFADRKLTGFGGNIEFSKDAVAARNLAGKLDGEDLKASFKARDILKHPKAEFEVKLAKLALKDLPPAQAAPAKPSAAAAAKPAGETFYLDITGHAEIGAIEHPNFRCGPSSMNMALVNISDDLAALDGSASFKAGPGKFSELFALAGRYKAAKVALYPLIVLQKASKLAKNLHLPDFNNIAFDLIEGDYAFDKGLMKLNKSSLTSAVADVASSGSINLPAEKLDMKINTTLKEGSGIRMTAPLGMLVKGTFTEPSVKADLKSIVEQPAVKKALDKALPGASKLLKGLFKK